MVNTFHRGVAPLVMCLLGSSLIHAILGSSCSEPISLDSAEAKENMTFHDACITKIRDQISMEFRASLQYLMMGAHFDQDHINLAGYSKIFYEMADEEREHGIKLINYLRQRGDNEDHIFKDIQPILGKTTWENGETALRDALMMEKKVTESIHLLIKQCDSDDGKDYHAADWLVQQLLDEQLDGQHKLAGMINELNQLKSKNSQLGDWMYSNQLL